MSNVRLIDPLKDRLRRPRFKLLSSIRRALENEIAGYGFVCWDRDGIVFSSHYHGGPVSRSILPAVVHDTLQRHVTLDVIEDGNHSEPLPDPEGA